uniref:Uncharacterized protein n=1 Tax=Parascaris univalens TaxID=6257 RepID=A0A915ADJ6_PARUN
MNERMEIRLGFFCSVNHYDRKDGTIGITMIHDSIKDGMTGRYYR